MFRIRACFASAQSMPAHQVECRSNRWAIGTLRLEHAHVEQPCIRRYPAHDAVRADDAGYFGPVRIGVAVASRSPEDFGNRTREIGVCLVDP